MLGIHWRVEEPIQYIFSVADCCEHIWKQVNYILSPNDWHPFPPVLLCTLPSAVPCPSVTLRCHWGLHIQCRQRQLEILFIATKPKQ